MNEGHTAKYTGADSGTGRGLNRGISMASVQAAIGFAASVMGHYDADYTLN